MELVNLYVPLLMPDHAGFHDKGVPPQTLFGYPIRLGVLEGRKHFYAIEFQGVPRAEAGAILQRFRVLLPWASMRLDCSIQTSQEGLEQKDATSPGLTGGNDLLFNGKAPTAYPSSLSLRPIFSEGWMLAQEPITKLVELRDFTKHSLCSQRLTLKPPIPRNLWSLPPFRGSIRRSVAKAAGQLGKPHPQKEGVLAAELYDDRGKLVHDGIPMHPRQAGRTPSHRPLCA